MFCDFCIKCTCMHVLIKCSETYFWALTTLSSDAARKKLMLKYTHFTNYDKKYHHQYYHCHSHNMQDTKSLISRETQNVKHKLSHDSNDKHTAPSDAADLQQAKRDHLQDITTLTHSFELGILYVPLASL